MFWNFSLPAKRKSSTCTMITPIRKLFSCHVNIDGYISDTFPPFAKTNAFIPWYHFNDASERGVTFHSLLVTRWKSLLLVTCCKIARHSLQNSLVTRCRSSSLQKITRYLLQNSLVTRCRICLLQKITRYSLQKFVVAKNHSLLAAELVRYSLQKFTRHSLWKKPEN